MRLLFLSLFSLTILFCLGIADSALQVPFQDYATPGPSISSKIYYLQDYCSICEKFRPDFTKIKPPPEINETTTINNTVETSTKNVEESSLKTLKRVPRESDSGSLEKDVKSEKKPEIIMLGYDKDSDHDSDLKENGTWSWRRAYQKIRAKWIEKYENNTALKFDQGLTAKIKVEKTPEGELKKKFVLEFKKKMKNLTSLNVVEDSEVQTNDKENNDSQKDRIIVKRELKQIFLDPIQQPSIVIRSKRSATSNQNMDKDLKGPLPLSNETMNNQDDNSKHNSTYENCRLLIRFKSNSNSSLMVSDSINQTKTDLDMIKTSNETSTEMRNIDSISLVPVNNETEKINTSEPLMPPTPKNADLGLMINTRRFVGSIISSFESEINRTKVPIEQNLFWNDIRIFTSDPDMTEYWYEGKRMDPKKSGNVTTSSRMKRSVIQNSFIDMIDINDIIQLLVQNESYDLNISDEKWILLERKIFFDDPDDDDDEELIINLFFKPKENPEEEIEHEKNQKDSQNDSKSRKSLQCPLGTFDCNSDGSLCIPNSLKCNGEDNCGNAHDEMLNCESQLNLLLFHNHQYDLLEDTSHNKSQLSFMDMDPYTEEMFWFGTRILFILFATSLFLYIILLLCRMCDRIRCSEQTPMFVIPKGNYISISGDTIERKTWPFSKNTSSKMDTHGSRIREYIYVNNNYGQPQGSTMVSTDVQPPYSKHGNYRKHNHGVKLHPTTTSPDITDDEYPPLYEDSVRNYGTKK